MWHTRKVRTGWDIRERRGHGWQKSCKCCPPLEAGGAQDGQPPPPVSSANGDKPSTSICPPSPAKSPLIAGHAEERWLFPSWLEWQRSVWKLLTPTRLLSEVSGGWRSHHETGTNGPVSNRLLEKQMPVPSLPYPWQVGWMFKKQIQFLTGGCNLSALWSESVAGQSSRAAHPSPVRNANHSSKGTY